MDAKKKRVITAMSIALIIAIILPGRIFTASGERLKPEFISSIKSVGQTISQLNTRIVPQKRPTPIITSTFTIFPTGQIYIAPSMIVQPTQIIYPTTAPTSYLVNEPPVVSVPTTVPLPTVIYNTPVPMPTYQAPTQSQQPTFVPTAPIQTNSTMADFGKCLTSKAMVMYSQEGCPSCAQQKKLLAEAYQYVTVVNCSSNPKPCMDIGLKTTPSWAKNNKLVIPGYSTLDYLAQVSGCQLP